MIAAADRRYYEQERIANYLTLMTTLPFVRPVST
jgi:hypothetical protein